MCEVAYDPAIWLGRNTRALGGGGGGGTRAWTRLTRCAGPRPRGRRRPACTEMEGENEESRGIEADLKREVKVPLGGSTGTNSALVQV